MRPRGFFGVVVALQEAARVEPFFGPRRRVVLEVVDLPRGPARAPPAQDPLDEVLVGGALQADDTGQAAGTVRQEVVEPLKQQAVQAGKAVAGELQPAAQQRVERVKRTATTAATRVKEEAQSSAGDVQSQAGAAAQSVKGQAKRATKTTKSQAKAAAGTTKSTAKRSAGQVRQQVSV